ncbi:uncharacterized protein PG998_008765 [Apiospora kogelbergensis]|uniref:Uncharacterized protein n=1 Tax=Apiospora kogelbergensis TaxID=1337665 RepID=A0AAW0QAV2_9PEZI
MPTTKSWWARTGYGLGSGSAPTTSSIAIPSAGTRTHEYGTMDDWDVWLQQCTEEFKAKLAEEFVAGVIRKGAKLERPME